MSDLCKISDPFVLARFFSNVEFSDNNSCWGWKGIVGSTGYARFSYKDKHQGAHRISYRIFFGEIPQDMVVCHKCDNPLYTNPLHLFLGSQSDNLKDAVRKGRMFKPDTRAQNNGNTKLNWPQVRLMRELSAKGYKNYHLASLFQVFQSTVGNIINQETWKECSNA